MEFLKDEGQRKFCCHLAIILTAASVWAAAIWMMNGYRMKETALEHDSRIVSMLIEQGVSETVIIESFVNGNITEKGTDLLKRMGIGRETEIIFLPEIWNLQERTGIQLSVLFFFLWISLFLLACLFFSARERVYRQAIRIIGQFMKGDFTEHLPRMEEGCLYRLFDKIDGLANALSAGNEEAIRAKNFLKGTISDISHQLKTPLSSLIMYNEIIEAEARADTENKETILVFTEKAAASITRIEDLILALLKVTRLDAGAVAFERQNWLLADVVSRSVEELWVRAKEEEKEIVFEGSEKISINCDLQWTSEAIGNLVKNALDYTDRGGKVLVSWEKLPEWTRLSVSDNGKGIDEKEIYHIFKRFYRAAGGKKCSQGVGLGLPLAKSIIEGQGGTLSVQSRAGEGTVFTIMLPK